MSDIATVGFRADTSGLIKAEQGLDRVTSAGKRTDTSLSALQKTVGIVGTALAAIGSTALASQLTKYADVATNIENRLRTVTSSTEQLASAQDKLLRIANATRSEYQTTAELYTKLSQSTTELGLSSERLFRITETINKSFAASGASAQEASNAIRQLAQGLASGALRGDEFNSVAEQAPEILRAVAAQTGKTVGELREFAAQGGITAELLIKSLENYEQTVDRVYGKTNATLEQNSATAANNAIAWVGNNKLIMGSTAALGAALVSASENIDALASGVIAAAAVYTASLIPAMASSVTATYQKIAADIAATNTARALAAQELARVAAAKSADAATAQSALLTLQLDAQRKRSALEAIAAEIALEKQRLAAQISEIGRVQTATRMAEIGVARAAINRQLAATELELTAATTASNAASASAVAAQTALAGATVKTTAASAALSTATSFLLGPWGLLITALGAAAAAFYITRDSAEETTAKMDEQAAAVSKLAEKYSKFSSGNLAQTYADAQMQAIALSEKRIQIETRLAEIAGRSDITAYSERKRLNAELSVTNENLGKAELAVQAVNKVFEDGIPKVEQMVTGGKTAAVAIASIGKSAKGTAKQMENLDEKMGEYYDGLEMLSEIEQERIANAEKLMEAWSESTSEMEDQISTVDSLVDAVNNLGGAWSSSGSAMLDAFGSAADVIDDYIKRVGEVSDLEVKLKAVRDDSASSASDKSKAEIALLDLQYQGQRANLSMLGKTAGAAASMFKEQSKERKALHNAERVFAAVEIALALKKAGANALTAITSAFAAPFPMNFAAGAAMIGIMAGLGVFGGGGGGGYAPPTSGTGTVEGDSDTKSASINNVSDEYKDIALDQLFELQGIRESMNQLAGGIANLAVSLVRSSSFGGGNASGLGKSQAVSAPSFMQAFGDKFSMFDPIIGVFDGALNKVLAGIFGTTKKSLIDTGLKFDSQSIADILSNGFEGYYYNVIETTKKKMFGLSKKTSTGTELQDVESGILSEIGAVFGFLAESITGAIDSLGVDTANSLQNFVVNLGSVSFKDMNGEEIQKALEAMFSQQGDLMAEYVFPHIKQYQQMGEGALETLMRVAKEQAMFDDGLNKIGQSLGSASRIMQIDVAQAIATMMGGMDEFASKTNQYFKAFFSESEQLDYLSQSLTESMGALGLPMSASREGFRAMVDSLDLTTESGQKMFATLMQLVPGMDDYFKAIEKQRTASEQAAEAAIKEAEAKAAALKAQGLDMQVRLYDALGQSAEALAMRRQMELEATDETLRAILLQIYAAQDAATAQNELASAQSAAADSARNAAAAARDMAQSAFNKLQEAAQVEKDRLATDLELKLSAIDKERDALTAQRDSVIAGYREQGQAVNAYVQKLEGLSGVINDFLGQTGAAEDPFKRLGQIFSEVKAGLLPEQGDLQAALSGVSSAGAGGFGSQADASFAMAVARNQASEIGKLIGGRASGARSQVQLIEQQIVDAEKYFTDEMTKLDNAEALAQKLHDEQVGKIDQQLSEAQKQLNALLGVDDRILTMTEAAAEFYAALAAANGMSLTVETAQVEAINRVEAAVIGLGVTIAEAVTPAPPPMDKPFTFEGVPNVGEPVTREMVELLKELVAASDATAKHTKTTANVLELNQYEAQEAAI